MSVERIIRPFESDAVFTARRLPPLPSAVPDEPETAVLEWAGKADANYQEDPPPYTLNVQVEWAEDASARKIEKVRIENPDDPTQFVEVERIRNMELVNSISRERIKIRPNFD